MKQPEVEKKPTESEAMQTETQETQLPKQGDIYFKKGLFEVVLALLCSDIILHYLQGQRQGSFFTALTKVTIWAQLVRS